MNARKLIKFSVDQFLDTGFHVGSIKYNTNTYSYLLGQRGSTYLFDLEQSFFLLKKALQFVERITYRGGKVFFMAVTPSRSLQRFTYLLSSYCFQPCYAVSRWEGGVLSNWRKLSLRRWRLFKKKEYTKIQLTKVKRRKLKSMFYFYMSIRDRRESIRKFGKLLARRSSTKTKATKATKKKRKKRFKLRFPVAVFLYNPLNIPYPVLEAFKIEAPLIGVTDSDNIHTSKYTYPIPGNDDSASAYRMVSYLVAFSCMRGIQLKRRKFWFKVGRTVSTNDVKKSGRNNNTGLIRKPSFLKAEHPQKLYSLKKKPRRFLPRKKMPRKTSLQTQAFKKKTFRRFATKAKGSAEERE